MVFFMILPSPIPGSGARLKSPVSNAFESKITERRRRRRKKEGKISHFEKICATIFYANTIRIRDLIETVNEP